MLIAKLDRCTRSVADLASLIDTFSRRGVALISAAESLDTSSAGGRLVVNVLGAVAQWEREAIAERTSAALQVLKQQGRATGGVRVTIRRRPPRRSPRRADCTCRYG